MFREQFDGLDLNEKPGEAVPSKPKRERKKPGTFTPHAINAAKTHSMKLRSDLEEDKASTSDESLEDESYGRGGAEIPHGAHRTPLGRPGQSY